MRMVSMLVAMLIVGFLVYKQSSKSSDLLAEPGGEHSTVAPPKVPTTPSELQSYDTKMNQYMTDEMEKRKQAIEDAEPE
ncbi:hypothetical protein M5M_11680 [Simiduia agarivorans SA1 = DSM 21679]|uniref:Uncharacterized protein n=2 Tax=Simiduia TaxID=447467 RepID=K4KN32_SIMAS|nr:hypothetical protein M5M_11680 [Simiduia agarivorans SA1 = DSM 21679]